MPSAAVETTRKPRDGKKGLSNMTSSCSMRLGTMRVLLIKPGSPPPRIEAAQRNRYTTSKRLIRPANPA
jgi:hypothetical protein